MNKPIRVLQVLTIMNLGGAETMIMNYYRNIDRTKVQFDFLLHRPERGAYDDEIEALGGIIYRLSPISPRNFFRYKKELKLFFEEHQEYKIIHSHLNSLSTFILNASKPIANTRISHSHIAINPIRLSDFFNPKLDFKTTLKDAIQVMLRRSVAKHATHYFACGKKAGNWMYGDNFDKKITIINNAIDALKFTYNSETAIEVKNKLAINENFVVGHIGRFNDQKNHFFLINIFKEIIKIKPNAVLVLIGEGGLKTKIEAEANRLGIKDAILFLGLRKDIPDILQSFDVFLFPSLYEGLPVTLIEAQASGLRIFASNTISKEVNFTGLVKFLSLKDTAEQWAQKLIENSNYNRENTYESVVNEGYDIMNNAKELENFYLSK
ncbi:glycosyltransferase [Flavobacteriaceae bacterium R38]|nr:glycosyltransferase [Flavobacteriaceae bacterium R38]